MKMSRHSLFSQNKNPQHKLFYYLLFLLLNCIWLSSQTITTIAGTGVSGFSGDGGPSTAAQLSQPYAVAVDTANNLYVAEIFNQRVRKVNSAGIITTYAGTGVNGYSGDGGPATSANVSNMRGIDADTRGNIYIADYTNNRLRKIDVNGVITTLAGTGPAASTGDGGLAVNAQLNGPYAAAADTLGNVYIADMLGNRVRKINPAGIISTYAGTGSSGYNGDGIAATSANLFYPSSLYLDTAGNLYIADYGHHRIRMVNTAGIISTVAGNGTGGFSGDGGPATAAQFNLPRGVTLDRNGNMYVADRLNNRIRKINSAGTISTLAGNGTAGFAGDGGPSINAQFNNPTKVTTDQLGNLFVADYNNQRVRKIHCLYLPKVLAVASSTNICVGDSVKLTGSGAISFTWSGGITNGNYAKPVANTTYTLTGSTGSNCASSSSVMITVHPAPSLTLSSNKVLLCKPSLQMATLTAIGATSFSWSTGEITSQIIVNPSVTTSYTATGISANGCKSEKVITQNVSTCANLESIENFDHQINIYPNPNSGIFTIQTEKGKIEIFSSLGKKVYEGLLSHQQIATIQLQVPSGLYFVRFYGEHTQQCKKIIVGQ